MGSPTPFLVKEAFRDPTGEIWLKVLPRRPNGIERQPVTQVRWRCSHGLA